MTADDLVKIIQEDSWAADDAMYALMALEHSGGLDWLRCFRALQECKAQKLYEAEKRRRAKAELRLVGKGDATDCLGVALGLPAIEGHQAPRDYRVTRHGIALARPAKDGVVWEHVSDAPVVVTAQMMSARTGESMLTLSWMDGDVWRSATVTRTAASDARELLRAMSRYSGFPGHTRNSSGLAEYLVRYVAHNRDAIAIDVYHDRLGWTGDGDFIVEVNSDNPCAKAVREAGSVDEWAQWTAQVVHSPMMLAGLCASVAAALVKPLQVERMVLDLSGPTSTGKSTALYAAAAVWGYPGRSGDSGLISSWNNTRTAFAELSGLVGDLPLILDEAKLAAPGVVHYVIHSVVDGISRQRGGVAGGAYSSGGGGSTVISTGESPLFDQPGVGEGAAARTISLRGDASARIGGAPRFDTAAVALIKRVFSTNYGFLGPACVQAVMGAEGLDWLRGRYVAGIDKAGGMLSLLDMYRTSDGVRGRVAERMGLLMAAWDLVERVWPLICDNHAPLVTTDHWEAVLDLLSRSEAEVVSSRWEEALDMIRVDLLHARGHGFWRPGGDRTPPYGGWLGAWIVLEDGRPAQAILPSAMDAFFRETGLNKSEITRAWADQGILVRKPYNRRTYLCSGVGGQRGRHWVIDPDA